MDGCFSNRLTILVLTKYRSNENTVIEDTLFRGLYQGWNTKFKGASARALRKLVRAEETNFWAAAHYSKTIPIIQSSGTGKSHLLDEISKDFLTVTFVLKLQGEAGYPPGDQEIMEFLIGASDRTTEAQRNATLHARVVALLGGAIARCKYRFGTM